MGPFYFAGACNILKINWSLFKHLFMNKSLIFILLFLINPTFVRASHILGAEITYRHLGGLKYELTIKVYRDCRGVPLDSVSMQMKGGSLIDTFYPNRVQIRDLTPTCKSVSKYCDPANQTTSSGKLAMEEHLFRDTVDFEKEDSAFRKQCIIQFGVGGCCKAIDMSTSIKVWVWSELDICKASRNSSPVLNSAPNNILCCNQSFYYCIGGRDTVDHDSLSYSFVETYQDWSKYNPLPTPPKEWISTYWPTGYNRSRGPNPSTDPPIGMYLDPETGDLIFIPTDCSGNGNIAFKVTEWRKDGSGNYIKIGEVRRDILFLVQTCPGNNPPRFTGVNKLDVCAGNKICFNVTADDKTYIPPPPGKALPPDTVILTWNYGINRGAKFEILDKTARIQTGRFCWTPHDSDARSLPYYFTASIRDNSCPTNASSSKAFSIRVKSNARTKATTAQLSTGMFELSSKVTYPFSGTPTYKWQVSDSVGSPLEKSAYYFRSNIKSPVSVKPIDSVQFRRGGKYIIHHTINNPPLNCPTTYVVDTVSIPAMMEAIIVVKIDTFYCRHDSVHLKAKVINGTPPYKYRWGYQIGDSLSETALTTQKDSLVELFVTDAKGQKSYFWYQVNQRVYPFPIVDAGKNVSICVYDSVKLKATATHTGDSVFWNWIYNSKTIGNKAELTARSQGNYYLQVMDMNGCKSEWDSVNIKHSVLNIDVDAGHDASICYGDSVLLTATGLDSTSGFSGSYKWIDLKTLMTVSNLSTCLFRNRVDTRMVVFLEQTDSLKCKALVSDTVDVKVRPLPVVELSSKIACQNESELSLHSIVLKPKDITKGKQYWYFKKTLDKPGGAANKPEDLIYNKDSSGLNNYYIKIGESSIDLHGKYDDSLGIVLIYKDVYGCTSLASNTGGIVVRSNLGISFLHSQIPLCHGDSITYLSNSYGVNYFGGDWYSCNDSAGYLSWPQGNHINFKEKVYSDKLPNKEGVYHMRYILENNQCFSSGYTKLKIETYPEIKWSELTVGDSVTFTDHSVNATSREWLVGSFTPVSNQSVKLSRFIASTKTIILRVKNGTCMYDSLIKPMFTGFVKGMNLKIANLFPNPTTNILRIELANEEVFDLQVVDALGRVLISKEGSGMHEEVSMSTFPSGIYTVILSNKSGKWYEKVIKQ